MNLEQILEKAIEILPEDMVYTVDRVMNMILEGDSKKELKEEELTHVIAASAARVLMEMQKSSGEDTFSWLEYLIDKNSKDLGEELEKACRDGVELLREKKKEFDILRSIKVIAVALPKSCDECGKCSKEETCPICGEKFKDYCKKCVN